MNHMTNILEEVIQSITRLRNTLSRGISVQVDLFEERAIVKATAYAWFNKHRPSFGSIAHLTAINDVDNGFNQLLEFADRRTKRSRINHHLKILKSYITSLRSEIIQQNLTSNNQPDESLPNFAVLVSDPRMLAILKRRWEETKKCLSSGAHLAATVMMGALLEALFLARANRLDDKTALFKAKSAPIDSKTKTPLPLTKWTLNNYIEVAHEIGWIRESGKNVGIVLRDYRNFIHPSKELSHNIFIDHRDSQMFWVIFKSLASQVIDSV